MIATFSGFHITTKLSLVFTALMLFAIPVTVLSLNIINQNQFRAEGLVLGNANYPDPVVSWGKEPQYRMDLCLNTTDRNSSLCNKNIFINGNNFYSASALNNFRYYWFVMIRDNSGSWVDYQKGDWLNTCFNAGGTPQQLCNFRISWNNPEYRAQAVYSGVVPLRNACDQAPVSSCSSTKITTFPSSQVQFVDLPPNINIDTYVYAKKVSYNGDILFTIVPKIPTGSVSVSSAPTLSVPKFAESGVTTDNTPFAWSAVSGASYYGIWVSTSPDFLKTGFWYKNVPATACNASSCLNNWNTIAWSTRPPTVGSFPQPPTSLEKGKTYYWSVWACSSTDCPAAGLSQTWNFTTESSVSLPLQPAGLKDSDSQATVPAGVWGSTHKFEWISAGADLYAVDISSDQNFNGGFVNKVITTVPATALTTYSVTGDSGWANQGNATYSSGGKLALQDGVKYYWRVYAKNSAGHIYSQTPNKEVIKPATSQTNTQPATPAGLVDSDSLSIIPAGVWGKTHKFEWKGANTAIFAVDVSTDPNFVSNWAYKRLNVTATNTLSTFSLTGTDGWGSNGNVNYISGGNLALQENTTYYWRVWAWNGVGVHSSTPNPKVNKPPTGAGATKPSQPANLGSNIESLICGISGGRYGAGLTFSWAGTNATEYAVDVSESASFAGFANKVVGGSAFSVSGNNVGGAWTDRFNSTPLTSGGSLFLTPGKTYYWRVWAGNSAGSVYDTRFSVNNPVSINLPVCSTNIAPSIVSPPRTDASPQPVFSFKPSSANYYGIAVSDNRDDLLNFRRLWRSYITTSSCGPLNCVRNWVDPNWYSYGGIEAKPFALTPGKTYYWYVWACDSTGCPLNGRIDTSFTIKGSVENIPATNLTATPKNSGYVELSWKPASSNDGGIEKHRVLLKTARTGTNFSVGDYWYTDVPAISCFQTSTCKANPASGTWTFVKGPSSQDNIPNNPPEPLFIGDWNWVVIACKTTDCNIFSIIVSQVATFKIADNPVGTFADLRYDVLQKDCINGLVRTNFSWQSGSLLAGAASKPTQVLQYSVYNNNFLSGTYQFRSFDGEFLQNEPYGLVIDLAPNTTYFWRVGTIRDGYTYSTQTKSLTTKDCPAPTPPSGGTPGSDLERSGTVIDVQNYVRQVAGGSVEPKTGRNLADVMVGVMAGESGGGDCAYHVDYKDVNRNGQFDYELGEPKFQSTIGVFQFSPNTWQSQQSVGSFETANYVDSGSILNPATGGRRTSGCWKTRGSDDIPEETKDLAHPNGQKFWAAAFQGDGYDAGAWNPYAQVRAASKFFLAGQACLWSVFGLKYGGCG